MSSGERRMWRRAKERFEMSVQGEVTVDRSKEQLEEEEEEEEEGGEEEEEEEEEEVEEEERVRGERGEKAGKG